MSSITNLGYYWGDDGYGIEQAALTLGTRVGADAGWPLEAWRVRGDQTSRDQLMERAGTSPLFGGGTLIVVADPLPLARTKDDREALVRVIHSVAPGNALAFIEAVDASNRRPVTLDAVRDAIAAAGGDVRELRAPREGQMARWIEDRARERSVHLGAGAAQELAKRIGAFVREGDVDRRRQGHLAVGELDKLRLYRADAVVTVDDVRALVSEAVPGTTWGLLDAVAIRRVDVASELTERLVESTPAPVLLAVLHRRIRELLMVADLVARRATPAEIMKTVKVKAYPAEKLVQQSRAWPIEELEAALAGLLELDASIKGGDGQASPVQVRLAFAVWLAEYVARRPGGERTAGAESSDRNTRPDEEAFERAEPRRMRAQSAPDQARS